MNDCSSKERVLQIVSALSINAQYSTRGCQNSYCYSEHFDRPSHQIDHGGEVKSLPLCRYFPLDTAALMSRADYTRAVAQLKQHSADPWQLSRHRSSRQLNEDKFRHRRLVEDPQRCFQRPLASQQA